MSAFYSLRTKSLTSVNRVAIAKRMSRELSPIPSMLPLYRLYIVCVIVRMYKERVVRVK